MRNKEHAFIKKLESAFSRILTKTKQLQLRYSNVILRRSQNTSHFAKYYFTAFQTILKFYCACNLQ